MLKYTGKQADVISKFLVFIMCIIFGLLILVNTSNISDTVKDEIIPYFMSDVVNISKHDVKRINFQFKNIISSNNDVSTVVLYKFIPDEKTSIYKGQINVTMESRYTADDTIEDSYWIPLVNNGDNIQEILFNKIHYDTVSTIQLLCETEFDVERHYSCEKFKVLDKKYKSIITIPIINSTDYAVVGYVMILLESEYTNIQVESLINNILPYIKNIQPLVSKET